MSIFILVSSWFIFFFLLRKIVFIASCKRHFLYTEMKSVAVKKKTRWIEKIKIGSFVEEIISSLNYEDRVRKAGGSMSLKALQSWKQLCVSCALWGGGVVWWFIGGKGLVLFLLLLLLLFFLPDVILTFRKMEYQSKLKREMSYFLDVLIVALSSGMNLENAFDVILSHKSRELHKIFRKCLDQTNCGVSFLDALKDTEKYMEDRDFQRVFQSIKQSKNLGVSLKDTLEIQSKILRTQRQQRLEEISRSAAVKISLPLVLCVFPSLLILYLAPGILLLLGK